MRSSRKEKKTPRAKSSYLFAVVEIDLGMYNTDEKKTIALLLGAT